MFNTKNLTHKLFITALMITMTNLRQLRAMEIQTMKTSDEILLDADFQAYKLLSLMDNHQCSLLPELIKIIATYISQLIDRKCYEEYEAHYETYGQTETAKNLISSKHYSHILLQFINKLHNKSLNHTSIATTIKRYLRYSDKSLGEIKDIYSYRTVFHNVGSKRIIYEKDALVRLMWIKILFTIVTKEEAWNIMCMLTDSGLNSLIANSYYPNNIPALLSRAPNPQEAWNFIMIPCYSKENTLKAIEFEGINNNKHYLGQNRPEMVDDNYIETLKILESYRPKEQ